jgi:hypothetical protein
MPQLSSLAVASSEQFTRPYGATLATQSEGLPGMRNSITLDITLRYYSETYGSLSLVSPRKRRCVRPVGPTPPP